MNAAAWAPAASGRPGQKRPAPPLSCFACLQGAPTQTAASCHPQITRDERSSGAEGGDAGERARHARAWPAQQDCWWAPCACLMLFSRGCACNGLAALTASLSCHRFVRPSSRHWASFQQASRAAQGPAAAPPLPARPLPAALAPQRLPAGQLALCGRRSHRSCSAPYTQPLAAAPRETTVPWPTAKQRQIRCGSRWGAASAASPL